VSASAYCATRFGVEGITECLALEVAPLGLHVTFKDELQKRHEELAAWRDLSVSLAHD
jgi:hypothetical protein